MIEHVFVLMLENRSFDHMLGWSGLQGTDATSGEPTAASGLDGSEANELASGDRVSVSRGAEWVLPIDPGHGFDDVLEQLCGRGATYPGADGRYPPISNSGFASRLDELTPKSGPRVDPGVVMRCFSPDQLPVMNALAREFAVCDHWFSSMPGPTWPNRLFVHGASAAGLDDSPTALRSATALFQGYAFANGTIYDRFDKAGIGWRVVEGDALPQVLGVAGMIERAVQGRFVSLDELSERLPDPKFPDSYVFIEPHYGHVLVDGSNFKCGNSQHPLDDVTRGEKLLKNVYELIRRSPHWPRSLLVVLYDEHGGFYDHVAPPACVPPGDAFPPNDNRHGFRFDQLGVRVPALLISPLTPRGLIDHTVYDHTSLLATIEHLWGLEPLTGRDAAAARFDHLFALTAPRDDTPTVLPDPADSGVPDCEDTLLHHLAGEVVDVPAELSGPLEATLVGFLQVAVARELHLAAATERDVGRAIDRERDRLFSTYHEIRTKLDAVKYLHGVARRYQETKQQQGGSR